MFQSKPMRYELGRVLRIYLKQSNRFGNVYCKMSTFSEFLSHFPDYTWDFPPEKIEKRCRAMMDCVKKQVDSIAKLPVSEVTFETVCQPLADLETEIDKERNLIEIFVNSSPDAAVRDKCSEMSKVVSDFVIELAMRKDVYDQLQRITGADKLPYESARYLDKSILYRKRDGLHLPETERQRLTDLFKEMSNLCIDFSRNISEENEELEFSKEELDGMTEDFFKSLTQKGDKYILTLKYPHVVPLLKQCKVVKTREIMEKAYNRRCIDTNIKILNRVLELRKERVDILKYKTHADYVTEILMSKTGAKVSEFLSSLFEKIKDSVKKEKNRMLELKRKECEERKIPFDNRINMFDNGYYQNMVEEIDFQVDKNLIKQYFPFEHVTQQLLEIYQTLLVLRFEKVEEAKVIHPEVSLYAVFDQRSGDLLGYFYLDLFPRPFKYTHAACFPLHPGCDYKGKPRVSCAVMMANFTKPLLEKPSLLTHEEVETYFHEFGHVMHHICSRTKYSMFHGTSVERDFVEAPSQMLENWCWEEESLRKLSCHYETKKPLPDELIKKICKSRMANIALFIARQISLSMFDHIIHTTEHADTFKVYHDCLKKYLEMEPTPGTNFAAAFGHMCGGYDAQYYGYLWSQVYSYDMFKSRFKQEGIFNPETGMSYRMKILYPGSTKDGSELLRDFLGRDPIMEPFLESAGIK
ncbi:Thimet oligopeptidase [Thelohanellus kitauei]|uniref:Thimet oligopeptidase n=1 Tax=Thelohanellus kitauei TaxID=669202 RepID=A0A0C2IWT2_THEKT|nr:Thimet oligopeptidase [Thelohanellus kitauei]